MGEEQLSNWNRWHLYSLIAAYVKELLQQPISRGRSPHPRISKDME